MTIDEIFAALPEEPAQDAHEFLVIDPASRTIQVPQAESIFGVEGDEDGERKYFICPRYVGDHIDLAACFLSIVYRNANGELDQYLVEDTAINGEYVTFSWLLSEKVVKYKGAVQFRFDADTAAGPAWGTTMANGESLEGLEPEIDTVEEQTSDVVTQLRDMVTRQTGNVEAVGAAQVAAVEAQGTASTQEAVAAIQAQGEATNASIPAEYTELEATVDRLTRDRAAAIVCQAEGDLLQITDASNDPLQGLRIFGRSTQDGTPTPDNPAEIVSTPAPVVGVYSKNLLCADSLANGQFVKNADGTYTLTKNGTGGLRFSNRAACNLPKGTYTMSVRSVAGVDDTVRIAVTYANGAEQSLAITAATPKTFDAPDSIVKLAAYIPADTADGSYTTMGGLMLEHGTKATEYEPYKALQTLAITTPGSLPGIPVASGGNYTDANGQQWIADEVDLARGVYVQRVALDELTTATNYANRCLYCRLVSGKSKLDNVFISSHSAAGLAFANGATAAYTSCVLGPSTLPETVVDLTSGQAWLEQQKAAGTPFIVGYVLTEPVETPLTNVEPQAYLALRSNKPTTTVLNDAGAHMVLEYAADPKTFICNQIAAAIAAK